MGSGNWIVDNLNSALEMWNGRLAEIWQLISTSPESFKGGGVWNAIVNINDGLKAVGSQHCCFFCPSRASCYRRESSGKRERFASPASPSAL